MSLILKVWGSIHQCFEANWPTQKKSLMRHKSIIIFTIAFQFLHMVATNLSFYLHIPREPFYDLGFEYLFGPSSAVSVFNVIFQVIIFFGIISLFIVPCLIPRRIHSQKNNDTIDNNYSSSDLISSSSNLSANVVSSPVLYRPSIGTMLSRFCLVLVTSQCLRIIIFLGTIMPGPHPRCSPDSIHYNPPPQLSSIFNPGYFIDSNNCGDGVFSMLITFYCICMLMVYKYYNFNAVVTITETLKINSGGYGRAADAIEDDSFADDASQNNYDESTGDNSRNSNTDQHHTSTNTTKNNRKVHDIDDDSQLTSMIDAGNAVGEVVPDDEDINRNDGTLLSKIYWWIGLKVPFWTMFFSVLFVSFATIANRYHFSLNIFAAWFTVFLVYVALEEHYPDFPEDCPEEYLHE